MTANRSAFVRIVGCVSAMLGLILQIAPSGAQIRPGHKFFFPEKAEVASDDEEVTTRIIVGDEESEGRYTILSDLWKVGFRVGTHYHARHFETFYLLSGEAEWTVNGESHRMKAGDAVYIPASTPHSAKTLGNKPAHFILIYSAGDYEAHLKRESSYSEAQRKDPKVRDMLRELNDFHPVAKE